MIFVHDIFAISLSHLLTAKLINRKENERYPPLFSIGFWTSALNIKLILIFFDGTVPFSDA